MEKGYCMKCKAVTANVNPILIQSKSGGDLIKSSCNVCGSKKSRFISKVHKEILDKKLNKQAKFGNVSM